MPARQAENILPLSKARIDRIASIAPPAHDLTDFWKAGGDVRAWAARHVARALEKALKGAQQLEGLVTL